MCIGDNIKQNWAKKNGAIGPGLTGVMATGQSYSPRTGSSRLMRTGAIMPVLPLFGVPQG